MLDERPGTYFELGDMPENDQLHKTLHSVSGEVFMMINGVVIRGYGERNNIHRFDEGDLEELEKSFLNK